MANYDLAQRSGVVGRIRWVIDEDFLYAYRSHEIIHGAADDADEEGYIGQPLAIFAITTHADVRREYSATTGEPTNVLSESMDRQWYDRQFMRVDWSMNLVSFGLFGASLELDSLFQSFTREPVANFVQEGGDQRIPDSWRPQFVRVGEDENYRFRDEWPTEMSDSVHYMSFVTNELWTPNQCFGEACASSVRISLRNAFLRVPPNHTYATETLPNSEYDRFGIIRTEARTYIAGGQDRSSVARYCDAACTATCDFDEDCGTGGSCAIDANGNGTCAAGQMEDLDDCGVGNLCNYASGQCAGSVDTECGTGYCNVETHICEGGLTPNYGETDNLTFQRLRHNFYRVSLAERDDPRHTDGRCAATWQCDNRFNTAPDVTREMTDGSVCDPAAQRCTIPIARRELRPVDYYLSPGYPRELVRSAFEVIAEWNDTFMLGNRALHAEPAPEGSPVACQGVDPTQYCYCGDTVTAPEVLADRTCAPRSNFFVPPAERGETNPFDCWIAAIGPDGTPTTETASMNPAAPESYGNYGDEVYTYGFVGEECMLRLNVNSCDRPVGEGEAPAACEDLGDLRYQFFNFATGAGAGWCGVMQQVSDPTNGEAISIPINMGGLCLDRIATNALRLWPVLRGEITEDELYAGEDMRGYFENLGNVHVPVGFAPSVDGANYDPSDPSRPAMPVDLNGHLNDLFNEMAPNFESLSSGNEGRAAIRSDRLSLLQGTNLERRLVEGMQLEGVTAIASQRPVDAMGIENGMGPRNPNTDAVIDQISPFRDDFQGLVASDHLREMALANNYVYYPRDAIYTSRYNQYWANAFAGRPNNNEAQIRWRQAFHKAVMLHELGHGLGLEHNFAGSFDRDHYQDGYFNLVTRTDAAGNFTHALPTIEEFDCGADGLCPGDAGYVAADIGERDSNLTSGEATAWGEAIREIRTRRALDGIGNTMTSSLMDYNGDLSDMGGLGHYDRAAVYFNYFNLVEAFEGDPTFREGVGTSLDGLARSDVTPRRLWTWYRGGETCDADTDCPYAAGSAALTSTQGTFQRCVRNPRYSQIPTPCDGDRNCICSNFDEDLIDLHEFAYEGYQSDRDGDGVADYDTVDYMFCSNSRLGDISWCNTFDAGESFQETIDHWRQLWQEGYPNNYRRNYRRGFSTGSRAIRYIIDAAKVYQHLFFRYFNEPEFRRETGPLGFNDQYLASVDAMNWLAELSQLPDVGSYQLVQTAGPDTCSQTDPNDAGNDPACRYAYAHMGEDMDMAGADFSLAPGQGYSTWSRYQEGLYGFFRLERAGVFWDKLIAMQALTIRDWGLSFSIDERYFINFYDLFPIEMTEIFGGYVINDDEWIAPRVRMEGGDPQVVYLNYLRGNCRDATTGAFGTCRDSNPVEFTDPPLQGTSNEIQRLYAAIFALAQFPVYYDPSFESRLAVYKLGSANGFTVPDVQLDGEPTQAFGAAIPGSGHAVTTELDEADYITFVSDRLNTPFLAVKLRTRLTFNLEEEQLGFQLLVRLNAQQERVRELELLANPTPAELRELGATRRSLIANESFVESLIEVQDIFGITSIF